MNGLLKKNGEICKMTEIQKEIISNKKINCEFCSVCGISQEDYGFTFETNDKNELLCSKCAKEED